MSQTTQPTQTQPTPTVTASGSMSQSGSILEQAAAEIQREQTSQGESAASESPTQHVGPAGQQNPRNVYAATSDENTPEGAAAALARREQQHPILSGIGKGAESLLQPVFHPIDTVENLVKQTLPPFQLYDATKKAYPLIQAYENARSQGHSVWESISAANDQAKKQDAAHQALEKAIADYKKNPTETTANILTQVAGNVAMLAAGGRGATMEAEAPATVAPAIAAEETPTAEVATVSKPAGIFKQILKGEKIAQPQAQTALRNAPKAAGETAAARPTVVTEDANPPMLKVDSDGNPVAVDGQHRAAQLVTAGKGDEPFTINYTDAAGKTTEQEITADQFLKRINRTPEDILKTDEQQTAVRAGNGEPRPAVTKSVAKAPTEAPKEIPAGIRTTLEDPIKTIEAKGQGIYRQLDAASGGQFQKYSNNIDKINKRLDTLIGGVDGEAGIDDDQIEKLEQQKSEIETSQNEMFENLKQTKGIDKDAVDTANDHWKQARALEDLQRKVFKNPNIVKGNLKYGTEETVNVDSAIKALQKMQDDTRFGSSRLEQALGKDGADALMKDMYKAQREGIHAMKAQQWAKMLAKYAPRVITTAGILGGAAYELTK